MPGADLHGVTVVVTRPEHQAQNLIQSLQRKGARVVRLPLLAIEPIGDSPSLNHIIDRLDYYHLAIFISANAVEHGFSAIQSRRSLPQNLKIAAVGKATARSLTDHGHPADILPVEQFNSEALLALDVLKNIAGQRVVIFRGQGGRELLAETLRERGAQVDYAECYRRIAPSTDGTEFFTLARNGDVDVVVVTSNEALTNLLHLASPEQLGCLLDCQLLVVSWRIAEYATQNGFSRQSWVSRLPSDESIIETIIQHLPDPGSDQQ